MRLDTLRAARNTGRFPQRRQGALIGAALALLAACSGASAASTGAITRCPPDAVLSGSGCMDRYEASVWRIANPTTLNRGLVAKIRAGKAQVSDLTVGGVTQLGTSSDSYAPCADDGQNCVDDIYAVSVPGVIPARNITWFQAQQACSNSGKRLPSNAEWQVAVTGTPDPDTDNGTTDCKTTTTGVLLSGARKDCVSARGAFDMVGNLDEFVADWVTRSTTCGTWPASITSGSANAQCLAGAATTGEPGVLLRGGGLTSGAGAGPFSVFATLGPSLSASSVGFRCAR